MISKCLSTLPFWREHLPGAVYCEMYIGKHHCDKEIYANLYQIHLSVGKRKRETSQTGPSYLDHSQRSAISTDILLRRKGIPSLQGFTPRMCLPREGPAPRFIKLVVNKAITRTRPTQRQMLSSDALGSFPLVIFPHLYSFSLCG